MVTAALYLWGVKLHYSSIEWLKYSNCTVNLLKYPDENKDCQVRLIRYFSQDQMPLLAHVI